MSVNKCDYLVMEYVGRYHAAMCRCTNPDKCPRKIKSQRCKVNVSCFYVYTLKNERAVQLLSNRSTHGDGMPTTSPTELPPAGSAPA